MLTSEDLKRDSVEWIDGTLRIVAKFNSSSFYSKSADLYIYPDHPRSEISIKLLLDISEGDSVSVKVQDLQGNGYRSEFQGKGYGKLLFRVAVQCLQIYFDDKDPSTIQIQGRLSDDGDPDGSLGKECSSRRSSFWASLGFEVLEPDNSYSKMTASLDTLIARLPSDTGQISSFGLKSRYVNIQNFWVFDERPFIQLGDLKFIEGLNMNIWPRYANPSDKELADARGFQHKTTSAISYTILFFLLIFSTWLGLKIQSAAPLIIIILVPFISGFIGSSIIPYIPFLNKLEPVVKKRQQFIKTSRDLEEQMNLEREGINSRLRIAFSYIFPNLNFHGKDMLHYDLIMLIKKQINSPEVTAAIRPNLPI
jgi:hypothetical protein